MSAGTIDNTTGANSDTEVEDASLSENVLEKVYEEGLSALFEQRVPLPELSRKRVTIGTTNLELVYLENELEEYDRQMDYTGVTLWPGGVSLAHYVNHLLTRPDKPAGHLRVLELGAGTGIPALAAAKLADVRATLTDGNPYTVELLQEAISANQLQACADTCRLRWGFDQDIREVRAKCGGGYHMIVAGDVMYGHWKTVLDFLLQTVVALLLPEDRSVFLLSACFARMCVADTDETIEYIRGVAESRKLKMHEIDLDPIFAVASGRMEESGCSDAGSTTTSAAGKESTGMTTDVSRSSVAIDSGSTDFDNDWLVKFKEKHGHLLAFHPMS